MAQAVAANVCAGLLVVTAAVHSVLGEIRLIGPLLLLRDGVLKSDLARFLLRVVWHMMSVTFVILAASVAAIPYGGSVVRSSLLWGISIAIGGAGLIDAVGSRGQHIGWPLLVAIGLSAFAALYSL